MKRFHTILALVIFVLSTIIGCSKSSQSDVSADQEVTLKIQAAWAEGNSMLYGQQAFIEKVAQKTKGTVKIVWGGGPESIPSFQLVEALKNGVVDIAWTAHTYNVSYVPVMEAMKLTDASVMRSTGGFDFVNEHYMSKLNAHYVCASTDGLTYNLYTKAPINTLADFNGLTIRATPAYQAFVEGLGSGVVNTAPGEAYQALERNVIQGYGWPSVGVTDFGWQEVSKYIIEPAFYNVDVAVFISDKAWSKLSAEQQNAIMEAGLEIEKEAKTYYAKAIEEDKKVLIEAGMEEIKLAENVAQEYLILAYEKGWKSAIAVDAVNAEKLQGFAEYESGVISFGGFPLLYRMTSYEPPQPLPLQSFSLLLFRPLLHPTAEVPLFSNNGSALAYTLIRSDNKKLQFATSFL